MSFLVFCTLWFFAGSIRNDYLTTKIEASVVYSGDCFPSDDDEPPPSSAHGNLCNASHKAAANFYDDPTLSYSIDGEPIRNWDKKRQAWINSLRRPSPHHQGVLLVTGSQPWPCSNPDGDYLLLRLFKNKVDYCRIHGCDVFYSNTFLHPKMPGGWAKLPLIRAAMVAHPESEWIWWVDSDAAFTDMEFSLPLDKYKDYNLVINGWPKALYEKRSWLGLNNGVFLLRNCEWTMNFIQAWSRMGPKSPDFTKWGIKLNSFLSDMKNPEPCDQSAMVYLLLKERQKWGDKFYIEGEYDFQAYWLGVVGEFDVISKNYANIDRSMFKVKRRRDEGATVCYRAQREQYLRLVGHGNKLPSIRRSFLTHFSGCEPCSGKPNPSFKGDSCRVGLEKALNFADNQVLQNYGFVHPDLMNLAKVTDV